MATQTVVDRITQAQNLLIIKAQEFPSGIIPVEQMDAVLSEISAETGITRENLVSVGMETGNLPARGEIEIFRFKQNQNNQPEEGADMAKIDLRGKLKSNTIERLQVCIPFMQPDISYAHGKAIEALEALKRKGLECSHATLNNDIKRLKEAGATNLGQINLDLLDAASDESGQKRERRPAAEKKPAEKPAPHQLLGMIEKLEAEIAEKQKDLDILKAAREVMLRRGL